MLGSQELPPIDEAQLPPDVVALLQRMRLTVPEAMAGMERDGFTRAGVVTDLALA